MRAPHALFIAIDNLSDISDFFGEGAAGRVLGEVARRLEQAFGSRFRLESIESWGVTASASSFGDDEQDWSLVDAALTAAASLPISVGNARLVVALSCCEDRPAESDIQRTSAHSSAQAYRTDMVAAALAYEALFKGRLHLVDQPICRADDRSELLFAECLARLADEEGRTIMPGVYLSALERLGLTSLFDRQIIRAVIDQLRRRPDCVLGCNISALSASVDAWWRMVFPRLVRDADVAGRFVVEVTESACPYSFDAAAALVSLIQKTGCRVALDDFGSGFSSIGFARQAKFDIIKIDGSYVRNRASGEDAALLLEHLVALAKDVAGDVVVEGIESDADLAAAHIAGAQWLQGYLLGAPQSFKPDTERLRVVSRRELRDRSPDAGISP